MVARLRAPGGVAAAVHGQLTRNMTHWHLIRLFKNNTYQYYIHNIHYNSRLTLFRTFKFAASSDFTSSDKKLFKIRLLHIGKDIASFAYFPGNDQLCNWDLYIMHFPLFLFFWFLCVLYIYNENSDLSLNLNFRLEYFRRLGYNLENVIVIWTWKLITLLEITLVDLVETCH